MVIIGKWLRGLFSLVIGWLERHPAAIERIEDSLGFLVSRMSPEQQADFWHKYEQSCSKLNVDPDLIDAINQQTARFKEATVKYNTKG